ncbi:TetR/AcrR family transcriptional regulator [Nocardioides immobilis]|uniref:TetR/AcrR family transcriptional regulator n=1 Tax=Nocardioides immobilis TaxID=2049295 RepID=UPI001C70DE37|nr:TetR/AcrR family transcriptional regulator [Nocardioides immobilis]
MSPTDQILDAAAALFIDQGYAATTTRAIADRVGVTQPSIYYHFGSKEDILAELLRRIIQRPLEYGEALAGRDDVRAAVRLAALVRCDVHELSSAEHNVGSLFLLPEVRQKRFASFRADRARLQMLYRRLIDACIEEDDLSPLPTVQHAQEESVRSYLADAVFGLVESVISIREDRPVTDRALIEAALQASALRILGYEGGALRVVVEQAELVATDMLPETVTAAAEVPSSL